MHIPTSHHLRDRWAHRPRGLQQTQHGEALPARHLKGEHVTAKVSINEHAHAAARVSDGAHAPGQRSGDGGRVRRPHKARDYAGVDAAVGGRRAAGGRGPADRLLTPGRNGVNDPARRNGDGLSGFPERIAVEDEKMLNRLMMDDYRTVSS
jgi:hypothetical protein